MEGSSNMNVVHPGPTDMSLLTLQHYHVSDKIWRTRECKEIVVKRCDSAIWREPIHPAVQHKLFEAGFYGVYKGGMVKLDCALVTALVERWRPETHTFHLPLGEATITLEDVGMLWGLPIEGEAVCGNDDKKLPSEWNELCFALFGVYLGEEAFSFTSMRLQALIGALQDPENQLPELPTEEQCEQRARMYIALMLGGLLFSDTSGNKMKTMFLPLLSDFSSIGTYSWGSASLASLYQGMCRATKLDQYTTAGPFNLLQLWAWERLRGFRPVLRENARLRRLSHPLEDTWPIPLPDPPRAHRWYVHTIQKNVSSNTLAAYRDQLDRLQPEQFTWQPYSYNVPEYCKQGEAVWRAKVPMICFDIVEYYYPDRVFRQFGIQQFIPPPPIPVTEVHIRGGGRRGKGNIDYTLLHKTHITLWQGRHNRVVDGPIAQHDMQYNDIYMQWFRRHSRMLIGHPEPHVRRDGFVGSSASSSQMAQTLGMIYNECRQLLSETPDIDDIRHAMDRWRIDIRSSLTAAGEEGRILPMEPIHFEQPYVPVLCQYAIDVENKVDVL